MPSVCVCVHVCAHLFPLGLWNDPLVLHVTLVAQQHPLYIFVRMLEVTPEGQQRERERESGKEGDRQIGRESSA